VGDGAFERGQRLETRPLPCHGLQIMNKLDRFFGLKGEARLRYLDNRHEVLPGGEGDFVRCAVTGDLIALADLRYWSVERQEAYVDASAAVQRHLQLNPGR
jgi:hypothetical protein